MGISDRQAWLVLSHAFNMDGRAASQIMTDKIPHLVAAGVTPIVLSAVTGRRDPVLEHHQLLPPAPSGLRFDLRHYFNVHVRHPVARRLAKSLVQLLLLPFYLLEKLLLPIENNWSWFIPAYRRGARLIRERRPALVYSCGSPSSGHLAAYLLKKKFGLPWLCEVQDPLVYKDFPGGPGKRAWALFLEKRICAQADVAWWFTPAALERARARHPALGDRGRVLHPAADPPRRAKIPYCKGATFVLAHFGSLSPTRNLTQILPAIATVLERHPEYRAVLRLRIYGSSLDKASAAALREFPYADVVEQMGRIEADPASGKSGRERVLDTMDVCDALLLLHGVDGFTEEYFPSKAYEYLWTQRPILGLIRRNPAASELLAREGHLAVDAENPAAVAQALAQLLERWQRDDLADNGRTSPYSAQASVAQILGWAAAARQRAA
jgi:glycosyltransferase involved in cell wall biosynthesis